MLTLSKRLFLGVPELVLLHPGYEVCVQHCRDRPHEAHKYPTKEGQNRRLSFLEPGGVMISFSRPDAPRPFGSHQGEQLSCGGCVWPFCSGIAPPLLQRARPFYPLCRPSVHETAGSCRAGFANAEAKGSRGSRRRLAEKEIETPYCGRSRHWPAKSRTRATSLGHRLLLLVWWQTIEILSA